MALASFRRSPRELPLHENLRPRVGFGVGTKPCANITEISCVIAISEQGGKRAASG